jgi:hypothetical protein
MLLTEPESLKYYGSGTCCICNCTYEKLSHNATVCSDRCRDEKARRRKSRALALQPVQSPCPICGTPARRYNGRIYITCGALSCRLEHRRQHLQKRYHGKAETAMRESCIIKRVCLKCNLEFMASHRFIRICPSCHHNFQANPIAADWWG